MSPQCNIRKKYTTCDGAAASWGSCGNRETIHFRESVRDEITAVFYTSASMYSSPLCWMGPSLCIYQTWTLHLLCCSPPINPETIPSNWTRLKCLKMKYTGGWFPPSLIILLIWAVSLHLFSQETGLSLKALDVSFCLLQVHPLMFFHTFCGVFNLWGFFLSFHKNWRLSFSSHFKFHLSLHALNF